MRVVSGRVAKVRSNDYAAVEGRALQIEHADSRCTRIIVRSVRQTQSLVQLITAIQFSNLSENTLSIMIPNRMSSLAHKGNR